MFIFHLINFLNIWHVLHRIIKHFMNYNQLFNFLKYIINMLEWLIIKLLLNYHLVNYNLLLMMLMHKHLLHFLSYHLLNLNLTIIMYQIKYICYHILYFHLLHIKYLQFILENLIIRKFYFIC